MGKLPIGRDCFSSLTVGTYVIHSAVIQSVDLILADLTYGRFFVQLRSERKIKEPRFDRNAVDNRFGANEPCSGCLHPIDDAAAADQIPTVSFVSFWAGLAMAVRLVREALVQPYPPNQQHLWLTPLRMDQPHAAMWSPVTFRRDCPVPCVASQAGW